MSILVVFWHLGGAGKSGLYTPQFAEHAVVWQDVVNFYILLTAVPTFFFISLFLYASSEKSFDSLVNRTGRLLTLLVFWPVAMYLAYKGLTGVVGLYDQITSNFSTGLIMVLRGGGTIYYFFASLIICTFLVHIFHGARNAILLTGLIISLVSVASLPAIAQATNNYVYSVHWTPLNFVPYVFAALVFANNLEVIRNNRGKVLIILSAGVICSAIYEWHFSITQLQFLVEGYAIPPYMRPSLTFLVMLIATLALTTELKSNRVIRFMAKYSLALFCLHSFFIEPGKILIGGESPFDLVLLAVFCTVMSYIAAFILSKFLSKKVLF